MNLLVFVHTVTPLLPVFERLTAEILPGVKVKHILDEPLLEAVRLRGKLDEPDAQRLKAHVDLAESIGASAVLVTCSTISPLVDQISFSAALPVFKVDEAMLDAAVQSGKRIGVLATNPTTLEPTRQLLEQRAALAGKQVLVETMLVPGALDALMAGDGESHDRWLAEAVHKISQSVDAVVLAQASMARVLEVFPMEQRSLPILSSPHLALQRLKSIFPTTPSNLEDGQAARSG